MKKLLAWICLITLVGCSMFKTEAQSAKEDIKKEVAKQIDQIPDWYLKPPKDADALYEKAAAKSRDVQMAVTKATMLARAQLAITIQGEVNSIMKMFMDENGPVNGAQVSNNVSIASVQEAIKMRMNGVQEEKTQIFQEGDKYVAYVLLKYPLGDMNKLVVEQIRQNDVVNSKVRADEAYDEIDRKIQERRGK
jgi:hypothetical protein